MEWVREGFLGAGKTKTVDNQQKPQTYPQKNKDIPGKTVDKEGKLIGIQNCFSFGNNLK